MNQLLKLIQKGKMDVVFSDLELWFENHEDKLNNNNVVKKLYNDFVHISSTYHSFVNNRDKNLLEDNQVELTNSRITSSLLNLIDDFEKITSDNSKKPDKSNVEIEITLNRDFDSFTEIEQKRLLNTIENFLRLDSGIVKIKNIKSGSVKVKIEIPSENLIDLLKDTSFLKDNLVENIIFPDSSSQNTKNEYVYYSPNIKINEKKKPTSSKESEKLDIENNIGQLVAFPVTGQSMEPIIMDGDIVIARKINNFDSISDNEIYVIKTNNYILIKYVRKIVDKEGEILSLRLISANNLNYNPFTETINETTEIYKVIRKISKF